MTECDGCRDLRRKIELDREGGGLFVFMMIVVLAIFFFVPVVRNRALTKIGLAMRNTIAFAEAEHRGAPEVTPAAEKAKADE